MNHLSRQIHSRLSQPVSTCLHVVSIASIRIHPHLSTSNAGRLHGERLVQELAGVVCWRKSAPGSIPGAWGGGGMVDTADLKSASAQAEWGFESPPPYHINWLETHSIDNPVENTTSYLLRRLTTILTAIEDLRCGAARSRPGHGHAVGGLCNPL